MTDYSYSARVLKTVHAGGRLDGERNMKGSMGKCKVR